ncbi:T-complex protein 11-domain-containing protein [Amylostereum chailletii]|nr:T-complex protein 11-domain-containing protein [Amylostereum chailletii]
MDSLKELDLDAIMRNPQLRHDFLFDSGLTFRASSSRRKRDQAHTYWKAVELELRTGCTCVTFDLDGRPMPCVCVCKRVPATPADPVIACLPQRRRLTLRMPSRIKPLVQELRTVLISILNPQRPSFLNSSNRNKTYAQCQEQNAQHARRIRSLLDPDLIQQELAHAVFDPSGTFQVIGEILKSHCAPMRDPMIDLMVHKAKRCAPGAPGTKADAVHAIRLCFEILELMKLDVANHHMQTLRPHIIQSSPRFELRVFNERRSKGQVSLAITQQWLALGHQRLTSARYNLAYPARPLPYDSLTRRTRVVLSTLRGMIDLVFTPPSPVPLSAPTLSASSREPTPFETHLPGYPETLYLDHARLVQLTKDAADLTTLYMLLMLYRQLLCASPAKGASPPPPPPPPKRDPASDDTHTQRIKREILELAPTNMGRCFLPVRAPCPHHPPHADDAEVEPWTRGVRAVVLQVAARASEVRRGRAPGSPATAPEPGLLALAERWSDSHLRLDSPLADMLRNRLREAVFDLLVHTVVMRGNDVPFAAARPVAPLAPATATGLEALGPEVRQLTERLAKLAILHLNVYQSVYEQDGFGAGAP